MTHTANQPQPPTNKQLTYLKALAKRTGQTFTWPHSRSQARAEIARLKHTTPSTRAERRLEQRGDDRSTRHAEAIEDAAAIHGFEIVGHGSSATWSQRS